MLDAPQILEVPEQHVARVRLTVPRAEIRSVMGPGIGEVYAALQAQGITPAGPWLSYHLRMDPEVFDFAICVPVSSPVSATGRVTPGVLPAARVARTIYRGPYEGLGGAWGEFRAWIDGQGLEPRADLWECYLAGPESSDDPTLWSTQLNQPLAG